MAGSAGSPPGLIVYVCPNSKCRATQVMLREELPEGWAGAICYGSRGEQGRWHKPVMKVEYVPREQSDALDKLLAVECVNGHRFWVDAPRQEPPSCKLCPVCGTSSLGDGLALNSYREATSE